MKELYISDLDGTLLQPNVEVSEETIHILNELIEQGLEFSIATARSAASVKHILAPLNITVPVILMNGVVVYDLKKEEYIKVHYFNSGIVATVRSILEDMRLTPFVYEVKNNKLATYYTHIKNDAMKEFLEERVTKYNKKFTKVSSLHALEEESIIYFALLDTKDNLEPAYHLIKDIPGISVAFYRDVYFEESMYFLEIFSDKATKYNGVMYLKTTYQYDAITSFGDNLNDLPMFEASTTSCAVANGKELVKETATYVIGSNTENGVATYIKNTWNNNLL